MGSALLYRGRSTLPTTEQLARDVPERSEDEARPVTGAVHAGSSRRDSFAGAAGAGRSRTHDSAERWRAAGVVVPPREARGSVLDRATRPTRLERPARVRSYRWKTYGLPRPDVGNAQDATRGVI